MAGPAPGTIMAEDYFGNAPEWGEEADGGQQQDDDSGGEDDAEVQQECLHKFSTRDYIMEPSIFNTLKRCVNAVHTQGLLRLSWCRECDLGVEGISRQEGLQKMSSSSCLRTIQQWPRL